MRSSSPILQELIIHSTCSFSETRSLVFPQKGSSSCANVEQKTRSITHHTHKKQKPNIFVRFYILKYNMSVLGCISLNINLTFLGRVVAITQFVFPQTLWHCSFTLRSWGDLAGSERLKKSEVWKTAVCRCLFDNKQKTTRRKVGKKKIY